MTDAEEYTEKLENLLASAQIEWVEDWDLLDEVRKNVTARES